MNPLDDALGGSGGSSAFFVAPAPPSAPLPQPAVSAAPAPSRPAGTLFSAASAPAAAAAGAGLGFLSAARSGRASRDPFASLGGKADEGDSYVPSSSV